MRESLKQLYVWIVALAFLISNHQILAARVVSVLSGLVGAGVCYKLAGAFYFGRQISYLAALFYLISPFALFYDRLALADSLLTMLVGIGLCLSIQLWRHPSVRWSLALGIVLGLATLDKAYAALYYPMPMLLWIFWGKGISWTKAVKLLMIVYTTTLLAWLPIVIMGQEAYRQDHALKLITALTETNVLKIWWFNFLLIIDCLSTYLTLPFVSLLLVTLVLIIIKRDKPGLILLMLIVEPLLVFTIFFVIWYPRYLLPVVLMLSVLFAWGIDCLARSVLALIERITGRRVQSSAPHLAVQGGLFLMLCLPSLSFDYLIITAPANASFLPLDKRQYFEGWGAGYGLKESAQFIQRIAEQYPKMTVLRETDELRKTTRDFYLSELVGVSLIDVPNLYAITPQKLDSYAKQGPTLAMISFNSTLTDKSDLFNGSKYPQVWRLASFPKPGNRQKVEVYQWLLPADFALRWFQQGGDKEPIVAWQAADTLVTASSGMLVDWPQATLSSMETLKKSAEVTRVEYVLATPELIEHHPHLFAPFISTDGARLKLNKLPPSWRLAFAYPDLDCQWCLFQLRPPDYPTQVIFGESIELEGYDVAVTQQPSTESFHVTLYWKSLRPLSESYSVFIHLLDSKARLLGQVDEPPLRGHWLTNDWKIGDRLADRHTLSVDSELHSDNYTISIGLYNPMTLKRLPADSSQSPILDDAVTLTTLSIEDKLLTVTNENSQTVPEAFQISP